jgi:pathogenesis-related protein 1
MNFKKSLLILISLLFSFNAFSEQREISEGLVKTHNKIRQALGVNNLTWSSDLANYAQVWANHLATENECKMKHRPRSGQYTQRYGENIYWGSAVMWSNGLREVQKTTPEQVVTSWADEVKDYNYADNSCNAGTMCGHYTQVIWKSSKQVGCAVAICPDKGQIWVCNYNPPGNYVGEKPY